MDYFDFNGVEREKYMCLAKKVWLKEIELSSIDEEERAILELIQEQEFATNLPSKVDLFFRTANELLCLIEKKSSGQSVEQVANNAKCSKSWVYTLSRRLGRLPTVEEITERRGKMGRPKTYK